MARLTAEREAALRESLQRVPPNGEYPPMYFVLLTLLAELDAVRAERDRLRDIAVPTWRERGRDQAFIESLAMCHKQDADTMDEGLDTDADIEHAKVDRRERLDRAEATLAAIREPLRVIDAVLGRWFDYDDALREAHAASVKVLALLDAPPKDTP